MLKVLTPVGVECSSLQSKCGEIHYQKSRFHFLCVFCNVRSENHDAFRMHFESEHLAEFSDTLSLSFSNPIDIPFCEEETVTATNDNLVKAKKDDPLNLTEDKNLKEVCDSNHSDDGVKHTSESYKNETKELEVPSSCCLDRKTSESETCYEFEEENFSGNESVMESKIDWNTPFQPGFLKNCKKRPYKPRNKACICTYCGRSFRRRYQLDTHINIHTGAKPHQCEICGRQFRAVTTLQRHLNTHEKRNFSCSYCEKCFTHKVALLSHESRHTQERKESCDLCEKQFYTVNQLDTHKRRVHKKSNDVLPFACDLCSNRYRSMSMLSTHKCRKHYKTAKFQCDKCEKKFTDLLRLEEHQKIHVDKKVSSYSIT